MAPSTCSSAPTIASMTIEGASANSSGLSEASSFRSSLNFGGGNGGQRFGGGIQQNSGGGGRFLVNKLSGNCLDVSGEPGTQNGSQLLLWTCEFSGHSQSGPQTDQRWEMLPNGLIRNTLSKKCIDVSGTPGTANGSKLQLYTCEYSGYSPGGAPTDQFWEMLPSGLIRNKLSGKCIDVSGEPATAPGSQILLWPCETSGRSPSGAPTDQYWTWR